MQITLSFCEFMKINTEILHSYLGKSEKYLKFSKNLSKVLFVFAIYIDFHIRYYFESFISVSLNFVNLQYIVKVYCWLNGNTNRYTSCIIIRLYVEFNRSRQRWIEADLFPSIVILINTGKHSNLKNIVIHLVFNSSMVNS